MVFYEKLERLVSEQGITKNKLLTDLKLNRNSAQNWQKQGSVPRMETVAKIADYFNVTPESLANDDMELEYLPSSKKSLAAKLRSYYQRAVCLSGGYEINDDKLSRFSKLLNASMTFLTNLSANEYDPKLHGVKDRSDIDRTAVYDILELSDRCAEDEVTRIVMVQISKIILYRIKQRTDTDNKPFDLYKCDYLLKEKLDFLYTNKPCTKPVMNYGFNFTELSAIRNFTGLEYDYLLAGEE